MTMPTDLTQTQDEAQIRQLVAEVSSAICAKDVDCIMYYYDRDVVYFDIKPPFQINGADALRRIWEDCLPYFPSSFRIELRDLRVSVSGNLAIAHWLNRFTGMEPNHPAMQTWLRFTSVCQRKQGRWQIVHEHGSVPFDPHTSQAVFTLEP